MLLPRLNSPTSPTKLNAGSVNPTGMEEPTAAKMVEPPVNDIYLCDYCGADFSSHLAIKVIRTRFYGLDEIKELKVHYFINWVLISVF